MTPARVPVVQLGQLVLPRGRCRGKVGSLTATPFARLAHLLTHALLLVVAVFVLFITIAPSAANDADFAVVVPAAFTPAVLSKREAYYHQTRPALTEELLAAYVERQKQLRSFNGFAVIRDGAVLDETAVSSYAARRRSLALDAIDRVEISAEPALSPRVLSSYAEKHFVPTVKKVKLAEGEKLCLAKAIYHEARGESREGQLAVANVIINRAMSKKYPSSICGVVYQNADKGRYRCQFTFACDGRSEKTTERGAWDRSLRLAEAAFYEYQRGQRPDVVPSSVLYYHTTAVSPSWSGTFRRVAAIGAHVFYSPN
jgi:spore germination cell wall hydrolase CwlJ-like protein